MKKILLIEDDEEKSSVISDLLRTDYSEYEIDIARSLNGGLRSIVKGQGIYKLILLDMSMPNYDVSFEEPGGGKPESFAGEDILAQMKLRGIEIPTIVVTMFGSFGEGPSSMSIEGLTERLEQGFSPTYRGLVYYNVAQEGWRSSLREIISTIL
ncbi:MULTISPECIES: response regulator [Burkholderia]|uniref:response regulator n=1 Tax=Burkholderia TaxID=32008 RepID=UPI000F659FF5|nr:MULTISPECIES: response regulator [Burkholderia]MBG0868223.1 response regulator [Burkholderia sp. 9779_493]MDN7676931.1 response regulator [Burkholderia cenocepacia]